jgi:hypothetical protein
VASGAEFGAGVAVVGDLNGDGNEDYAVTAPGLGPNGAVFVLLMGADMVTPASYKVHMLENIDSVPGGLSIGSSVVYLGNGEIALAAYPSANVYGTRPGAIVQMKLSPTGDIITASHMDSDAIGVSCASAPADLYLGHALSATDINSDGVLDIVVSGWRPGFEGRGLRSDKKLDVWSLFRAADGSISNWKAEVMDRSSALISTDPLQPVHVTPVAFPSYFIYVGEGGDSSYHVSGDEVFLLEQYRTLESSGDSSDFDCP